MNGAGDPTPEPTAMSPPRQPSTNVKRQITIKSWALLVFLRVNVVATLIFLLVTALLDKLVVFWPLFLAQPLSLQVPLAVWLIAPPTALIWRWWWAYKKAEAEIQQEVEEKQRVFLDQIVNSIQRQIEEKQTPASARVVALEDMPHVVSLVGRKQLLEEVLATLNTSDTMGIVALEGMGGVGKTALAACVVGQLAEEEARFPGGVAWIACNDLNDDAGLDVLFQRVARALRLEQIAGLSDPEARRNTLGMVLRQGQCVLLALDNLEPGLNAQAALHTLAIREHTVVVLTARQEVVPEYLDRIKVPPLDKDPAEQLFSRRLYQANHDLHASIADNQEMLKQIVATQGGLPLAIELTAAYLGGQQPDLARLLKKLQEVPLDAATPSDPKRSLS